MAVLWWVDTSGLLVDGYRSILQEALRQQTGHPVTIERLSGGLWGRVIAHRLAVSRVAHWRLQVDRTIVHVRTLQLLRNADHPERAIRYIELDHPSIMYLGLPIPADKVQGVVPLNKRGESSSNSWDLAEAIRGLAGRWEIRIRGAEIGAFAAKESLKGLSGSLVVEGGVGRWTARLDGRGVPGSVAQAFGMLDGHRRNCEMEFRAAGFEITPFTAWVKYFPDFPVDQCAGTVRGTVTYQGAWPLARSGWSGGVSWRDGQMRMRHSLVRVEGLKLDGDFKSQAASVSVLSGRVFHPVAGAAKLKGLAVWDHGGFRVDRLEVEGQQVWMGASGHHRQGLGGSSEVTIRRKVNGMKLLAVGPGDSNEVGTVFVRWNPHELKWWTADPSREVSISGQAIFGATSKFDIQASGLLIEDATGFSQLSGSGSWDERVMTLSALDLAQGGKKVGRGHFVIPRVGLNQLEGWLKVEGLLPDKIPGVKRMGWPGRLTVSVQLKGTRDRPLAQVKAWLTHTGLQAGIWKEASCSVEATSEKLVVSQLLLSAGQLSVTAMVQDPWLLNGRRMGEGRIRLKNFSSTLMGMIEGEMEVRGAGNQLTLVAGLIETFTGRYRITGEMVWAESLIGVCRIEGETAWGRDRLIGRHEVSYQVRPFPLKIAASLSSALSIRGQPLPPLQASVEVGPMEVVVSRMTWGSYVTGNGRVRWGKSLIVQGALEVAACPLEVLGLVGGIREPSKGTVNGMIRLSGIQPFPAGEVQLRVQNGQLGGLVLGEGTVSLAKGLGDAYSVVIRAGEGSTKTISMLGTISWASPVTLSSQKKSPLDASTKVDLTWSCVNQPLASWVRLASGGRSTSEVSGAFRGHGRIVGTLKDPVMQGDFQFQHGRLWGNPYELISGSMMYERKRFQLIDAKWQGMEDQVSVRGLHLTWAGAKIRWACEEVLLNPYRVWAMRLVGTAAVTGVVDASGRWETSVACPNLSINGFPYGDLKWQVSFDDQVKQLTVVEPGVGSTLTRLTVQVGQKDIVVKPSTLRLPKGVLEARGTIRPQTVDIALRGVKTDTAFIMKALEVAVDGEGTGDFDLRVTGSLADPKVDGTLAIRDGRFELWPFKELKGSMTIEHHWMHLKSWEMSSPERFFVFVNGKIPIMLPSKEMSLDIRVDDRSLDTLLPLGWFKSLEGHLKGGLHFSGTTAHPIMNGKLEMERAVLRTRALFEEIRDAKGSFTVRRGHGVLEGVTGTIKGVPIFIKGSVKFTDYDPAHIDVALSTKGRTVEVNMPGVMPPEARAQMALSGWTDEWFVIKGPREQPTYQGKIKMQNGKFTWPPRYIEEGGGGSEEKVATGAPRYDFMKEFNWDVLFEVGDHLMFFNDYVDVPLRQGDQVIYRGPGRRINVTGSVRAEGGTFRYLNHPFKIVSGKAMWVGDGTIVYATARAETQFQGYRFTALVHGRDQEMGTLDELVVTITSDPPLSQQQIASMLTVGVDTTNMTEQQVSDKFQEQLGQIMLSQGLAAGTRNALRAWREMLGLDDLSFATAVDERRLPGAYPESQGGWFSTWQVGIGKYVTTNLFLGANILHGNLEGIPYWRQEFQVNYNLLGGYYVETKFSDFDQSFFLKKSFPIRF